MTRKSDLQREPGRRDAVITRGGLHGTVYGIADDIVTVEITENVRVKMNRDAIASVTTKNN